MFKTAAFDKLLEKATSKLLLEPDWDTTLQICDSIRQGDVQPVYVLAGIRKKIENENPHVAKFALQVLESVVKNCGSYVHIEVATREFMDFMRNEAKKRQDPVKAKIMELIQVWSYAFRNEPQYKAVQEAFAIMKAEGVVFPALKESDAMFTAEKAPDWRDGECCHRCRVQFSTFQRKHHCRACGQVFCQKCSSKLSIIPKFGIEKEVRVCDTCYEQINKLSGVEKKSSDEDLPAEYLASSLAKQPQAPPARSEQEIQEEEELQLALALSQSEAEAKDKERNRPKTQNYGGGYAPAATVHSGPDPIYSQPSKIPLTSMDTSDMDPELARYLDRNYWQQKSVDVKSALGGGGVGSGGAGGGTQPSAPAVFMEPKTSSGPNVGYQLTQTKDDEKYHNGETSGSNTDARDQYLGALRSSIEIFVNRMKSNSQRGRSIANDSSVQTLFMTLNAMHPQLVSYIHDQEEKRAHYESLQDKLTQLKDARDALDVLREEHQEKRRREMEEMERLRQIQMVQKLEVLRQKKQEYLEYQRQLALQRMQEQEQEMRRRLEQQKQDQHMRAMQYSYPQVYANPAQQPPPQGYSTGLPPSYQSNEASPLHQMHPQAGPYSIPGAPPGSMPPGGVQMPMTGQPVYNQQPGGGYPPAMMGYHVPQQPQQQVGYAMVHGGAYPPGSQSQQQQMYMPGPPPPASMEQYQPYNMQGISNALPPQQGGQPPTAGDYGQPGNQYVQQGQQQQPGGMMPPQGQGHPPPQQQLQHQPGPNESALINFD